MEELLSAFTGILAREGFFFAKKPPRPRLNYIIQNTNQRVIFNHRKHKRKKLTLAFSFFLVII
ncbi:MAG: hypothetical protein LBF38_04585, partial [Deltaproteobacteria bacterium]|nr:hypothetical protein [Deltaproteobacteria bacterium]